MLSTYRVSWKNRLMLPKSFGKGVVEDLRADTDSCCDTIADTINKPENQLGDCPGARFWWWQCGFALFI
jgi:hypothetical protein